MARLTAHTRLGRSVLCLHAERDGRDAIRRMAVRGLCRLIGRGGLGRGDTDEATAAATVFKLDVTRDQCEKRVVLSLTYVFAGLVLGASLANQNRAGIDKLSAEALYAEPLTVRITAVC
jgi:hypothetical protein